MKHDDADNPNTVPMEELQPNESILKGIGILSSTEKKTGFWHSENYLVTVRSLFDYEIFFITYLEHL